MTTTTTHPSAGQSSQPKESIKETLISIIIAFVLAFVFRGFVIEAFVIPTGSMAPTLMGAHMRFAGERSGSNWPVGPWFYINNDPQNPAPIQRGPNHPIVVHDPMTGDRLEREGVPARSGDRILVLKYLYALREPERFDVVVFKNPANSGENFIKRLIGLSGEQIALVDGDVFSRVPAPGEPPVPQNPLDAAPLWEKSDWKIARKNPAVARSVWQCVFDSSYTPVSAAQVSPFVPPWVGAAGDGAAASRDWAIEGRRSYTYTGKSAASLRWNSKARFWSQPRPLGPGWPQSMDWSIDDRYPYDEILTQPYKQPFPVSDIRMRAAVEAPAGQTAPDVTALIRTRGHEFRGRIAGGAASVEMRIAPSDTDRDPAWQRLGSLPLALQPGSITDVEFWHLDQTLQLWVAGKLVAHGEYNWTPAQRAFYATGFPLLRLVNPDDPQTRDGDGARGLSAPRLTRTPSVEWQFSGGPISMHRVAIDRDLHYRADRRGSQPGWATAPDTTMTLTRDEFFVCGDNSPQSQDGRLWTAPEDWVKTLVDAKPGVVPRRLLLGKAFFVYFPALAGNKPVPVPDFGRLRFIR